jgi:hypothetical protein
MDATKIISQIISDEIDHGLLMKLMDTAGVSEEEQKKVSENFEMKKQAYLYRNTGIIKNEQIHNFKIDEKGES